MNRFTELLAVFESDASNRSLDISSKRRETVIDALRVAGATEVQPPQPFHRLTCCVCSGDAGRWQQHWNRDTGYGVCLSCIKWQRGRRMSETEIADLYGAEGINWGKTETR